MRGVDALEKLWTLLQLRHPSLWSWQGTWSLRCNTITSRLRNCIGPVDFIIDVGAHRGQFAAAAIRTFDDVRMICLEPIPEYAQMLRRVYENNGRVTICQTAAGDTRGRKTLHLTNQRHSSSLLRPLKERSEILSVDDHIEVGVARLDSILDPTDEGFRGFTVMKIDVQGYELNVLRGSTDLLEYVDAIIVESALRRSYAGQPPQSAVDSFLTESGFMSLSGLDCLRNETGEIVEIDLLYGKTALS